MPARKGFLFDPDRYPFLEGHSTAAQRVPLVSDGVVFRLLRNFLILDGERLSYRTLDVEQIGSVYETMVGFQTEIADGPMIALKPAKTKGAPTALNLDELLAAKGDQRMKLLRERTDQKLSGEAVEALKTAATLDDLLAALDRRIARNATPHVVPKGAMILQPSDERRRSGSHYTPRSLTEPIVRKTLKPILQRLGDRPTPEQILNLKICDIAVGSGAFQVETSRQLGEELVRAWHNHQQVPYIPPDEDEVLHARRLVAQRCLYGVDRNPMAVDLAKLSLWLATLAKDHPFTFLDHSFRCGDSLVGLTRKQLADFHWLPEPTRVLGQDAIEKRIETASRYRKEILEADEFVSPVLKREKLEKADEALEYVRLAGDCVIAAFFAADNDRSRLSKRSEYLVRFSEFFEKFDPSKSVKILVDGLRNEPFPIRPFHWEIEYPEVFDRDNPGFDAIVGNPPFLGGTRITAIASTVYLMFLKSFYKEAGDRADLVAYFFRRAFDLLCRAGTSGLLATNTIAQGDTRHAGLRWICTHGGSIYAAERMKRWPGQAAVMVSKVFFIKGEWNGLRELDGKRYGRITAFLFHAGGDEDPSRLITNKGTAFEGFVPYGAGFLFCDTTVGAHPISLMRALLQHNPTNAEVIFPYLGGEELNDEPELKHSRFVIYFGRMQEEEVRSSWPDLFELLRTSVKPERESKGERVSNSPWWQFLWPRPELWDTMRKFERVLVCSKVSKHLGFGLVDANVITSNRLAVFALDSMASFTSLQSRPHELWARFFGSSLEDSPVYTPTDCFDTFPFPAAFSKNAELEQAGRVYYEFRAALMVRNKEGLTKTYNRFHDPDEPSTDIIRLRELHTAMDRAVLDAYGWTDIQTHCDFILDYEEEDDEDNTRHRKKPWRYRWPDEIRDEVLARLLALNKERAEEEALAGEGAQDGKRASKAKGRKKKATVDPSQGSLTLEDRKTKE